MKESSYPRFLPPLIRSCNSYLAVVIMNNGVAGHVAHVCNALQWKLVNCHAQKVPQVGKATVITSIC